MSLDVSLHLSLYFFPSYSSPSIICPVEHDFASHLLFLLVSCETNTRTGNKKDRHIRLEVRDLEFNGFSSSQSLSFSWNLFSLPVIDREELFPLVSDMPPYLSWHNAIQLPEIIFKTETPKARVKEGKELWWTQKQRKMTRHLYFLSVFSIFLSFTRFPHPCDFLSSLPLFYHLLMTFHM